MSQRVAEGSWPMQDDRCYPGCFVSSTMSFLAYVGGDSFVVPRGSTFLIVSRSIENGSEMFSILLSGSMLKIEFSQPEAYTMKHSVVIVNV